MKLYFNIFIYIYIYFDLSDVIEKVRDGGGGGGGGVNLKKIYNI